MFNRIVVPLDGSAFAEAALIPARELAARFGSKLLLTTAVEPLGLPPVRSAALPDSDNSAEELEEADSYLLEQVEKLEKDGFTADRALYIADAGAAIAGAAEFSNADLVVMATRMGWTLPAEGSHHSSVTLNVLARSRVPILSCHLLPSASLGTGSEGAAAHPRLVQLAGPDLPIIVPLDGSPFAEQALPTAQALAQAFGAYLVLVRAVAPGPEGPQPNAQEQREARDYLARIRFDLEAQGTTATTIAEIGIAINVIEHTWREQGAGLLVMASHGQTRHRAPELAASGMSLPGPMLGSVAAEILEELEVPTLVMQPGTAEAQVISIPGAQ
jgi:nucleotide-binding universal stress UspA family protein